MSWVYLASAPLHGADFTGCDLRGSDRRAPDPATAELQGAIITLERAILAGQVCA